MALDDGFAAQMVGIVRLATQPLLHGVIGCRERRHEIGTAAAHLIHDLLTHKYAVLDRVHAAPDAAADRRDAVGVDGDLSTHGVRGVDRSLKLRFGQLAWPWFRAGRVDSAGNHDLYDVGARLDDLTDTARHGIRSVTFQPNGAAVSAGRADGKPARLHQRTRYGSSTDRIAQAERVAVDRAEIAAGDDARFEQLPGMIDATADHIGNLRGGRTAYEQIRAEQVYVAVYETGRCDAGQPDALRVRRAGNSLPRAEGRDLGILSQDDEVLHKGTAGEQQLSSIVSFFHFDALLSSGSFNASVPGKTKRPSRMMATSVSSGRTPISAASCS